MSADHPLRRLEEWLHDARAVGAPDPPAMALTTADRRARPSARMVGLKRLDEETLVFTTALWTRKARELLANPHVALLFHWPQLGRQVHIIGTASVAERPLAEELFAERPRPHQLQALASRQGQPIDGLVSLRERLAALNTQRVNEPLPCPPDWGAIRVRAETVELWTEASDRLHDRRLYERTHSSWKVTCLAP